MSRRAVNITNLPRSPQEDRRRRAIMYTVMMLIRLTCFVLCIVLQGWWILVFGLGAIFLPYFAVVVGNAADSRGQLVERPGSIVRFDSTGDSGQSPVPPEKDSNS